MLCYNHITTLFTNEQQHYDVNNNNNGVDLNITNYTALKYQNGPKSHHISYFAPFHYALENLKF